MEGRRKKEEGRRKKEEGRRKNKNPEQKYYNYFTGHPRSRASSVDRFLILD
ncbi:hypothetical protein QUB56_08170 [Microcoleus sp. AR_TQ3_B6]|uniref:hypothetical protein n=1 Tax=Microcoleus sp. AR_TQ3_B6 TaxID=3055284 RepID=UPI002FCF7119